MSCVRVYLLLAAHALAEVFAHYALGSGVQWTRVPAATPVHTNLDLSPAFCFHLRSPYGQTDRQTDGRTDGQDP